MENFCVINPFRRILKKTGKVKYELPIPVKMNEHNRIGIDPMCNNYTFCNHGTENTIALTRESLKSQHATAIKRTKHPTCNGAKNSRKYFQVLWRLIIELRIVNLKIGNQTYLLFLFCCSFFLLSNYRQNYHYNTQANDNSYSYHDPQKWGRDGDGNAFFLQKIHFHAIECHYSVIICPRFSEFQSV